MHGFAVVNLNYAFQNCDESTSLTYSKMFGNA